MAGVRAGAYAPEVDEPARRPLLIVEMTPELALVGNAPAPLGLQPDAALRAGREFARLLDGLACAVAAGPKREIDCVAPGAAADTDDEGLRLSRAEGRTLFRALRKLGGPLRAELAPAFVEQLRHNGLLDGEDLTPRALTFQQSETRAPVLWEMLYEHEGEQTGADDWRRFWGFRFPLTHWLHLTRTEEIRLRHGLFAAVAEDLAFAGREAEALAGRLRRGGLACASLAAALRRRVAEELGGDAEAALGELGPGWLRGFLDRSRPDAADRDEWKEEALARIFNDADFRYDLLHFACHCRPGAASEFLSRLELQVAGESVALDVAQLHMTLKRKKPFTAHEPGPLVFLNACGAAGQSPSHEPPGFPRLWVHNRGALAVVATLCPVPDRFAHAFARRFYEALFRAEARPPLLAEALLETRRHFLETYNNPLGLAYVLYAMQGARVLADFAPPGPV
jgi:hypothetical protein